MGKIKRLSKKFKKKGFEYEILQRIGKIIILRKRRKTREGMIIGYEVIKVRSMKDITTPRGTFYPAHEIIPSNEQFGVYGWAYEHYENAMKKFNKLVNR